LLRLRNTSPAFAGEMEIGDAGAHRLHIAWRHPEATATLRADLRAHTFTVYLDEGGVERVLLCVGLPEAIPAALRHARDDRLAPGA
jgi:sucrose phosphorylase